MIGSQFRPEQDLARLTAFDSSTTAAILKAAKALSMSHMRVASPLCGSSE
jgi:hypothetical protein